MTLQELIDGLRKIDPATVAPKGFCNPHSWRGVYAELAFEPTDGPVTVGEMLAIAESAIGQTYEGWKGGDFIMHGHTDVHIDYEGQCGGSDAMELWFAALSAHAPAPEVEYTILRDTEAGHAHDSPEAAPLADAESNAKFLLSAEWISREISVLEALPLLTPARQQELDVLRRLSRYFEQQQDLLPSLLAQPQKAESRPSASLVESGAVADQEVEAVKVSRQQLMDSLNERPASMPVVSANLYLEQTGLLLKKIELAAASTDGGGPAASGLPVALQAKLRREMSRLVSEQQANELRENGGHGDFDAGAGQGRAFLAAEILADFAAPTSPLAEGTGTAALGSLPTRSRAAEEEALAAIRQRLAKVPGLPWIVNEKEEQIYSPSTGYYIGTEGAMNNPEIDFIVNASEDIKYLLSLVAAPQAPATDEAR